MSERLFQRLSPYLQEFIFSQEWEGFRPVQLAACDVLFNSDDHLLLSSATASGKTEAAFLPILTLLDEQPSHSVAVLYVSPLKALINDQFARLSDLLRHADIEVFPWHGDVSRSRKQSLLKNPRGILQITPESLESLLMTRSAVIPRLFGDLRFVIVDEVHAFLDADRGRQVQCLLTRIEQLAGVSPRRIGLSATLGDTRGAQAWLAAGTTRRVQAPITTDPGRKIRLALESFTDQWPTPATPGSQPDPDQSPTRAERFVFEETRGKKCLVFTNSRGEAEQYGSAMRRIANREGYPDFYHIHHGSIAAPLRLAAEDAMRADGIPAVTVATITLELGIDLGQLERIVQIGAPFTVSSFVQRLGRSGRRGQPSEIFFAVREDEITDKTLLPAQFPWEMLQCIAIIQLYLEDRWIEPAREVALPYGLLYHQTMSALVAGGEMTPAQLAARVLSLPPFRMISQEDYRIMLLHLIAINHLERTEQSGIIVGLAAEPIVNSFRFYSVFFDEEEYVVRSQSQEIGSIQEPPPPGERFGLAGRTWEVIDIDKKDRVVLAKPIAGGATAMWSGTSGDIHTRVLQRMRQVLMEDVEYPYLRVHAKESLRRARIIARAAKLDQHSLVPLGGDSFCLFPWMGSIAHLTLLRMLQVSPLPGMDRFDSDAPYSITFTAEPGRRQQHLAALKRFIATHGEEITRNQVDAPPVLSKFDEFIPESLLRKAYDTDRLDLDDLREAASRWT
jgi:ATP-dependent Lhr-like helicase